MHSIDWSDRSVTLKLHDGRTLTTQVDKSVEIYDRLKKGDLVYIRYTEAIAISVDLVPTTPHREATDVRPAPRYL